MKYLKLFEAYVNGIESAINDLKYIIEDESFRLNISDLSTTFCSITISSHREFEWPASRMDGTRDWKGKDPQEARYNIEAFYQTDTFKEFIDRLQSDLDDGMYSNTIKHWVSSDRIVIQIRRVSITKMAPQL